MHAIDHYLYIPHVTDLSRSKEFLKIRAPPVLGFLTPKVLSEREQRAIFIFLFFLLQRYVCRQRTLFCSGKISLNSTRFQTSSRSKLFFPRAVGGDTGRQAGEREREREKLFEFPLVLYYFLRKLASTKIHPFPPPFAFCSLMFFIFKLH